MNLNILSSGGSSPRWSAVRTMPSPAAGTKINRPIKIAAVVLNPSFALPGPAFNVPIQ